MNGETFGIRAVTVTILSQGFREFQQERLGVLQTAAHAYEIAMPPLKIDQMFHSFFTF